MGLDGVFSITLRALTVESLQEGLREGEGL